MGSLVIALSINPRPLSALELKLSGLIMESRVDTAGDNQNAHVIISNYRPDRGADSQCYRYWLSARREYKIFLQAYECIKLLICH